jgi:hypothetical protein
MATVIITSISVKPCLLWRRPSCTSELDSN